MKTGDRVRVKDTVKHFPGEEGTLRGRPGLVVPGPAWWVDLDCHHEDLPYDDHELEPVDG